MLSLIIVSTLPYPKPVLSHAPHVDHRCHMAPHLAIALKKVPAVIEWYKKCGSAYW
jgi:hypothetical protein